MTAPLRLNPDLQIHQRPSRQQEENIPKAYRDVAQGMEAQFVNHMLTEMRKSIGKDEDDSSSMDYYNSLLDSERAKIMTEKDGGMGIQKLIIDEIYPKRLRQQQNNIQMQAQNKVSNKPAALQAYEAQSSKGGE